MALESRQYIVAGSEGMDPAVIEYANSLLQFQRDAFRMIAGVESLIPRSEPNLQVTNGAQRSQGESSAK